MLQYGAPKYFEVIWKKKRQKKRKKTREKEDSLWVSPWF